MAHVHERRAEDAIPELRNGIETLEKLNFSLFRPLLLPSYALALGRTGQLSTATVQIAEAKELVEDNDARYSEAEICAVEGHLLQLQDNRRNARACFEHALGRARDLGHLCWELRAAEGLAALMRETGDADERLRLLRSVYQKFQEGHSLPMLKRVAQTIEERA
jgi:hypothetical protein